MRVSRTRGGCSSVTGWRASPPLQPQLDLLFVLISCYY